ncbi:MAG: hypothetical protein LBV71_02760 [Prevotella sp.]|jgi:hypothetical protein|nr:hypothetical protein [Prevotella sp.]
MRTKLVIFVFLMASFGFIIPTVSVNAAEPDAMESPVISSKSPSSVTLSNIEKMSVGAGTEVSSMASTAKTMGPLALNDWDELTLPGQSGETTDPGQVGAAAPIGDVTLPIVLFALVIYFVYRGVTTSKRKSNL